MRKKVLLLTATFLLSFTMGTITAQTTKGQKSPVTTVMAKKIGFYCQYNQRALSLFAVANPQQVRNRTDLAHRLLETLDKHLDCAENFIVTLYYNYGVEMAYFALKDAGFTIKETDIAETIFKKEKEKQDKITQEQEARRNAEEEFAIQERINNGSEFSKKELASETVINWNGLRSVYNSHVSPLFEMGGLGGRVYYVHIDKNGTLVADKNDDSFINKYVLGILENNKHVPAKILFKGDSIDVNTEVALRTTAISKKYSFDVKKSKKGWTFKSPSTFSNEREKDLVLEIIKTLNADNDLLSLKNKTYLIEAEITTHLMNRNIFVQETCINVYSGGFYSSKLICSKHYPFTKYKALETEKIRVIYAE